ncbi:MAG: DUF6873 family GME fold protein [Anaerovoracaceae bacterium]
MGTIFISEQASSPLKSYLKNSTHNIISVKKSSAVYEEISAHPDIYMCKIGNRLIADEALVTEPAVDTMLMKGFTLIRGNDVASYISNTSDSEIIFAGSNLGMKYPHNVAYNALATDKIFIHNLKLTDSVLKKYADSAKLTSINVRQGYTKCSCIPVGDTAVITYDEGIAAAIEKHNEGIRKNIFKNSEEFELPLIDILLIRKGYVKLHGFDYGFLGGASGTVDNKIIFNGDIDIHPDAVRIRDFIEVHGFGVVSFPGEPLSDIGSVICLP